MVCGYMGNEANKAILGFFQRDIKIRGTDHLPWSVTRPIVHRAKVQDQ